MNEKILVGNVNKCFLLQFGSTWKIKPVKTVKVASRDELDVISQAEIDVKEGLELIKLINNLPFAEADRCHYPALGIELLNDSEQVFICSICWKCNSIFLTNKGIQGYVKFDGESEEAKSLLDKFKIVLRPVVESNESDIILEDVINQFKAGAIGEIIKTQTTYLDFVCTQPNSSQQSKTFRVHFGGKRDFFLEKGKFNSLVLLAEHPLLLEYKEPLEVIHLDCLVTNKKQFISDLESAANRIFGNWRNLYHFTTWKDLEMFLSKSYGILLTAPESFANQVMKVAEQNNVKLNLLNGYQSNKEKLKILLMDSWYVVADDFMTEIIE